MTEPIRALVRARAFGAWVLLLIAACARAQQGVTDSGFVAGARDIFSDDFSQTAVGAFPSNWTLKGPGGGGNPLSVVERDGARFLQSQMPAVEGEEQTASTLYARLPRHEDLPQSFTIEFDAVFGYSRVVNDLQAEKQYDLLVGSPGSAYSLLAVTSQRALTRNAQASLNLSVGKVHHVAIRVDGRSVRAFVDGRGVISDPEGAERPIVRVGIQLSSHNGAQQDDLMFTHFRIGTAAP